MMMMRRGGSSERERGVSDRARQRERAVKNGRVRESLARTAD